MAAKSKRDTVLKREASPVLIIVGIVIVVLLLSAGGYYAFNGGWKTASQQDEAYKHELLPIMAAKHGDNEALDAENKLRKEHGQAALEMPKGKREMTGDDRQKLENLQKQLLERQGKPAGP